MGTYPTNVEEEALQISELCRSNLEQSCGLVVHSASNLLVGSKGIYVRQLDNNICERAVTLTTGDENESCASVGNAGSLSQYRLAGRAPESN